MPGVRIDEHGRTEPPEEAGELDTLLGFLDYQRATLAWKCAGLDSTGLNATVPPSSLTLGGLLKHMAFVEDWWFSCNLHDRPFAAPWDSVDWKADRDWEFHTAKDDAPEQLRTMWHDAVARSRVLVDEALSHGGLDQLAKRRNRDDESRSLRWIIVHMIEEYARHNGHADLLRESVDGETGE